MFIYSAAWNAREKGEALLLLGFDDLARLFPSLFGHVVKIKNYPSKKRQVEGFISAVRRASKISLLGRITLEASSVLLHKKGGRLPLTLFDAGYCQTEKLISREPLYALRDKEISDNRAVLQQSFPELFDSREFVCFVHVRRGDYLRWPSTDAPAALPTGWYLDQISKITRLQRKARFLVFTDDVEFCELEFADVASLRVAKADSNVSWLAMSMCDSGILSASTYSWWAGWFASYTAVRGEFIAPRYWNLWRKRSWPRTSPRESTFITWADVTPQND